MDDFLWGMTWINATMYLSTIPVTDTETTAADSDNDVEYVSPEDELKSIQFGKFY